MINSAKKLPLYECLEVYFLVDRYIPDKFEGTLYDLSHEIFEKLSPNEFLECVCLLTSTSPDAIIPADGLSCYVEFTTGLEINNILAMKDLFRKLGFI